ncbi:MAG: FAD-dependent oxidoreductase [Saprospiraceae bacterium]
MRHDILIAGAGIVGLATALQLQRQRPDLKIGIIEKEAGFSCSPKQPQQWCNTLRYLL